MPEMPEVQAHAERMTAALRGATLERFQLLNFAGLKTFDPPADAAVGCEVTSVSRRAKYLVINFTNEQHHVLHLMQGGRLRPDAKQSKKPRNGIVRWVFDRNEAWLLTEAGTERKAGVWAVCGDPTGGEPLLGLGPEADEITVEELGAILAAHSKRIHGLLRDQRVIAGLGRLLTNEILFEAGLSPFANASKLDAAEVERLHRAITEVCRSALEHERTLDDIGKSAARPSRVHNRAGDPCVGPRLTDPSGAEAGCGQDDGAAHTVQRVEYRRYTVFYCPVRQTGGKLLADNTTSKFLK